MPDLAITALDDLTVLAARGPDAAGFLQGQLSQDVELLAEHGALWAGLHNPQGRCLALLRLFHMGSDQVLLVLPAELAETTRRHLARYVLRSRVKLDDASAAWRVYGATGPDAEAAASTRIHMALDTGGFRQLIVAPRGEALPEGELAPRDTWRLDDIESGLPEVFTATSGMFVAQMLNLDAIGAVSFDKGCYTGQEVIARAHFRGQVKRRMQRFHTESRVALQPGGRVSLGDGRRAQIVQAEFIDGGGQAFLAVTGPPTADATDDATEQANEDVSQRLECVQLPLPYPLPR